MKNKKQIATILVAAVVAFGLFIGTCPQIVYAAVNGTDNGTAEPATYPDQIADDTVFDAINNTASTCLVIENTGDIVNGSSDGLWVEVSPPILYNDSANSSYGSSNWQYVTMYGGWDCTDAYAKIAEDDNTTWHECTSDTVSHDSRTWFKINDSDWDYTFNTGDHMWVMLELSEAADGESHTMYEGLYTSQEADNIDPLNADAPHEYWGKWCIRGYA